MVLNPSKYFDKFVSKIEKVKTFELNAMLNLFVDKTDIIAVAPEPVIAVTIAAFKSVNNDDIVV